jgi:FG-GAP-like repeat/RTX calcium-binding nonapeptide repeat (4 copies)
VILGRSGGFPADVNLSSLTAAQGFKLTGPPQGVTESISGAGDVNGDGYDDVIVAQLSESGDLHATVYLVYGHGGTFSELPLADLDGTAGIKLYTDAPNGASSGLFANGAGDVNGDGFDDIVVGDGSGYVVLGGDFRGEATFLGTPGDDVYHSGAGSQTLIGGLGNDTLDGGPGIDVMRGGAGNDTFIFDALDRRVDGGSGNDSLKFAGSGQSLDLSGKAGTVYTGLEAIDLTGTGNNSLSLTAHDVVKLSDTTNQLTVNGNAGDSISSTGQGWVAGADDTIGGILYHNYTSGAAHLHVQANVTTTLS